MRGFPPKTSAASLRKNRGSTPHFSERPARSAFAVFPVDVYETTCRGVGTLWINKVAASSHDIELNKSEHI